MWWFLVNYFSPIFFILRMLNLFIAGALYDTHDSINQLLGVLFVINGLRPWKVGMTIGQAQWLVKNKYQKFIDKANGRYYDE